MTESDLDRALAAILAGTSPRDVWSAGCPREVMERAQRHSVHLLLASALAADPEAGPQARAMLREAAALDLVRTMRLARLTSSLSREGVRLLLIKGAAIAPRLYPAPHLRPRLDTDLLVSPADRARVEARLAEDGFVATPEALGAVGTAQSHWIAADHTRVAVDLHWQLFNAQPYRTVLSFDEVWDASVEVAEVTGARAPSLEHSGIIAAVHRVAHHYNSPRLVWLYDLHLIVSALGDSGLNAMLDLAFSKGVAAETGRGVLAAAGTFGTPLSATARQRLADAAQQPGGRVYLAGSPMLVELLRADLDAQAGWRPRVRLLREHLLPPLAYMRVRYPKCPSALLPAAYVYRILRGAPGWFQRPASDDRQL